MDCEVKGKLAEMEVKWEKAWELQFVTCEELLKSKTYLLKISQEESYPSELKSYFNMIIYKKVVSLFH